MRLIPKIRKFARDTVERTRAIVNNFALGDREEAAKVLFKNLDASNPDDKYLIDKALHNLVWNSTPKIIEKLKEFTATFDVLDRMDHHTQADTVARLGHREWGGIEAMKQVSRFAALIKTLGDDTLGEKDRYNNLGRAIMAIGKLSPGRADALEEVGRDGFFIRLGDKAAEFIATNFDKTCGDGPYKDKYPKMSAEDLRQTNKLMKKGLFDGLQGDHLLGAISTSNLHISNTHADTIIETRKLIAGKLDDVNLRNVTAFLSKLEENIAPRINQLIKANVFEGLHGPELAGMLYDCSKLPEKDTAALISAKQNGQFKDLKPEELCNAITKTRKGLYQQYTGGPEKGSPDRWIRP